MIYKNIDAFFESFIKREVANEEHKKILEDKIIEVVTYFKLLYINSGQGAFYNILSSYISDENGFYELLRKCYERQVQNRLDDEESASELVVKSIFSNNFMKKFDKEAKTALPPTVAIFFSGFYKDIEHPEKNWLLNSRNDIIEIPLSKYADLIQTSKDKGLEEVGIELCEDLISIREKEEGTNKKELISAYYLVADGFRRFGKENKEVLFYEKIVESSESINDIANETMIKSCNRLGEIYQENGKVVKTIMYLEKALKSMVELYGFKDIKVGEQNELIATTLLLHNDFRRAIRALQMVTSNFESNLGIDNPRTILAYQSMADCESDLEDYNNAYKHYNKIFDSVIALNGDNSEQAIILKAKIININKHLGMYDELKKLQKECLETILNEFHDDHYVKGFIKKINGDINQEEGKFNTALELYEYAQDIYTSTLGEDDEHTISLYTNIGIVYERLEQYEQALANFEKEYVIRKSADKEDNIKIVNLKEHMGNINRLQNNYSNALNYLNEALKFKTEAYPDDHKEMLSLFLSLGKLYRDTNNYVESKKYIEKALLIANNTLRNTDDILINIYWILAQLNALTNAIDEAYECYREAIVRLGELDRYLDIAKIYKQLTNMYLEKDDYEKATEFAIKSKVTTELAVGNESIQNIDCVNLLAHVYNEAGEREKAILEYREVCRIVIDKFGKEDHNLAIAYENMSGVLVNLEKYEYAIKFLEMSLDINTKLFGETSAEVANNYSNIAFIEYLQKKNNEALIHYEKVLQINEINNGIDASVTSEIFYALGRLYSTLGDFPKALNYYRRNMILQEKVVNDLEVVIEENYFIEQCYKFEEENNFDDCVNIFEQYLVERVKKQGVNSIGKGSIYRRIYECYKNMPDSDVSLQILYLNKALIVKTKVYGDNNPAMLEDFIDFATINKDNGNKEIALEYFRRSLDIYDVIGIDETNKDLVAEIKLNTGMLLRDNERFSEAILEITDAYNFFEEINADRILIWKAITELGNTYLEADETETALEYYLKTEEMCKEDQYKFKGCTGITFYNLGDAYRILNKKRDAVMYYEKALAIEHSVEGTETFLSGALETNIGLIYKGVGQIQTANSHFHNALKAYKNSVGEDDNNYKYITVLLEEVRLQILLEKEKEENGVDKVLNIIKGY